jgi:Tfp pilus assembly PilM family ATPase
MKISIDIECTPQEARVFLGLPDLEPMQHALTAQMQEQMTQYLANMDYTALLKTWLTGGVQSMEQLQSMFWSQLASLSKTVTIHHLFQFGDEIR